MKYIFTLILIIIIPTISLYPANPQAVAISDQTINKIKQFGDSIWAVGRGVSVYDKSSKQLIKFHQDDFTFASTDLLFTDICRDKNGSFYFSSNQGIWELNSDGKWNFFNQSNSPLPSDSVNCIIFDRNETLWIGTQKGLIRKAGQFWDLENYGITDPVKSITFDQTSDTTYICNGLHYFNILANGNVTPMYFPISPLSDIYTVSYQKVIKDKYGTKWISTYGSFGLVMWDGDIVQQLLMDDIPGSIILDLEQDNDGNLIGINGNGYFKFDINSLLFSEIDYNLIKGTSGKVSVVGGDNDGTIWFGGTCPFTHRTIVNNLSDYDRFNTCLMPGPLINSFYASKTGEVYLSNYKGLGIFDNHTIRFYDSSYYTPKISGITDISVNSDNDVYVVSQNKLYKFEESGLSEVLTQNYKPYPIYGSGFDSQDTLWLSSLKNIWRFYNNQLDSFPIPGTKDNYNFTDINIDKNNTKWVKTLHGFYGFRNGLWADSIMPADIPVKIRAFEDLKMYIDYSGDIWFSSINDIFNYDNKNWVIYSSGSNAIPNFKSELDKIPTLSFIPSGKMYLCVDEKVYTKEGNIWIYQNDVNPIYQKSYKLFVDKNDNKWIYKDDPNDIEITLFRENGIITDVKEEEIKPVNQFTIYPNPSFDKISILAENQKKFEIFDLFGKKVLEGYSINQIDISAFPAGIYFIKLDNVEMPQKFVKY